MTTNTGIYLDAKADYGAAGDGITDDTEVLQQLLLDARQQGKNAVLPPGTYLTSHPLTLPNGTTLEGCNPYNNGTPTTLLVSESFNAGWNGNGTPPAVIQSDSYAPDPTGANRWTAGTDIYCHFPRIANLTIDGNSVGGLNGIAMHNPGETAQLDRVHIRKCQTGLLLTGTAASFTAYNLTTHYSTQFAVRIVRHAVYSSQPSIGLFTFISPSGDGNAGGYFYANEGPQIAVVGMKMEAPAAPTDAVIVWGDSPYGGFGGATAGSFTLQSGFIQGEVIGTGTFMDALVRIKGGTDANKWSRPGIFLCGITLSSVANILADETAGVVIGRAQELFLTGEPFSYSTSWPSGPCSSAQKHTFLGGPVVCQAAIVPGSYTIEQLRHLATSIKGVVYVTDAPKAKATANLGCLAYSDGQNWLRVSDDYPLA